MIIQCNGCNVTKYNVFRMTSLYSFHSLLITGTCMSDILTDISSTGLTIDLFMLLANTK